MSNERIRLCQDIFPDHRRRRVKVVVESSLPLELMMNELREETAVKLAAVLEFR